MNDEIKIRVNPAYLTDEEVAEITKPLKQKAARVRYLRDQLGLLVKTRPDGSPLVSRSNFEQVLGQVQTGALRLQTPQDISILPREEPDIASLMNMFQKKELKYANGPQKKKQSSRAS